MDILQDILKTFLRQNEESDETVNESIETELTLDDDESTIEREIIKCQMKHGRLLIQTGKSLRRRYQNKLGFRDFRGQPVSDKVDRTIRRLAKRRYRGHCSVKAEQEQYAKAIGEVFDIIHKKQEKKDFENAL